MKWEEVFTYNYICMYNLILNWGEGGHFLQTEKKKVNIGIKYLYIWSWNCLSYVVHVKNVCVCVCAHACMRVCMHGFVRVGIAYPSKEIKPIKWTTYYPPPLPPRGLCLIHLEI